MVAAGFDRRAPDPTDRRVSLVASHRSARSRLDDFRTPAHRVAQRAARRARRRRPRPAGSGHRRARAAGRPSRSRRVARAHRQDAGTRARETFRSMQFRNFRLFFAGQMISQIGNWLTLVAQTLLVLKLTDNDGLSVGVLDRLPVRPGAAARRVGRPGRRPQRQAQAADDRAGAARCCSRSRSPRWRSAATRRCRRSTRSRSPAASPPRSTTRPAGRSWSRWSRSSDVQNAVSLNSALMTSSRDLRPGARRPAGRHRRLRLVLRRRRHLLHRRDRRPADDAHRRSCAPAPVAPAGQGPGPRRPALRPVEARAVDPAGDDGGRRHAHLQLPGRHAAVRQEDAARRRHARSRSCTRWSASARWSARC